MSWFIRNIRALRHGAEVEQETTIPAEAYGPYPEAEPTRFREEFPP